jgi:hypothetical protein
MEEQDQTQKSKPGLPEAVNPEIGNGALWEKDPHFLILRSADPTSVFDNLLFDESEKKELVKTWHDQLITPEAPDGIGLPKGQLPDVPRKPKKIIASSRIKTGKPDWLEDNAAEASQEPIPVEGKRVRKAIKKAQKQQKRLEKEEKIQSAPPLESNLSLFTQWLKSLKGSEYVHPYEDDYGLDQLAASNKGGISETLADLLSAQGYKDQAIDMYKLLMAKYPEKSSFFAAKIKGLQ